MTTCPHGNTAEHPELICAQCEADAERRPILLAAILEQSELAAFQAELPAELLPRPVGTFPI